MLEEIILPFENSMDNIEPHFSQEPERTKIRIFLVDSFFVSCFDDTFNLIIGVIAYLAYKVSDIFPTLVLPLMDS